MSFFYKLKISTISYIYIYIREINFLSFFISPLIQIEYSHRVTGKNQKNKNRWTLNNILSASYLVYIYISYILSIMYQPYIYIHIKHMLTYIKPDAPWYWLTVRYWNWPFIECIMSLPNKKGWCSIVFVKLPEGKPSFSCGFPMVFPFSYGVFL